ncbi:MAG: DUF4921 family protein [Candidatus Liptonbacteria bacterium]|nr:DUF4921 family protein [Candidatus Liptonbacteria bacterium]
MSEFRQDSISGEWVIIAPARAKRPHQGKSSRRKRKPAPRATCPFEDLEKTGNWPPIDQVPANGPWRAVLLPNKYPAIRHEQRWVEEISEGPYTKFAGVGHHDLVITRDHNKNFAHISLDQAVEVLGLIQKRYRALGADPSMCFATAFANWGESVGASIYHPHYQILTVPIVPPHIRGSLNGSHSYFQDHSRCGHCVLITYERKQKVRVAGENDGAIALAPYASRRFYEIKIFPKRHESSFELSPQKSVRAVAQLLQNVLRRMEVKLNDPDYNFYIHSTPLKEKEHYAHYHWHVEIIPSLPELGVPAGFELGTGLYVNATAPERAAETIRGRRG